MTDPSKVKADIVPYTKEYQATVFSWLDGPDTLWAVCRSKDYPPEECLIDSWHRPDVKPYLLFSENRPVAYGELVNRPIEMAKEIAHLMVDPRKRSMGYGTKMLQLLYNRAAARSIVSKVILHFYPGDETILGCYLKAGFELVGTTEEGSGLKMVRWTRV